MIIIYGEACHESFRSVVIASDRCREGSIPVKDLLETVHDLYYISFISLPS